MDIFWGSVTSAIAAEHLCCRWILMDNNLEGVAVTEKRSGGLSYEKIVLNPK